VQFWTDTASGITHTYGPDLETPGKLSATLQGKFVAP
jgi:hypothetical protein